MDGSGDPALPSAELSVTQLVLLTLQDAILAQPAGAPVAEPWGAVPWASKQLAQVSESDYINTLLKEGKCTSRRNAKE